MNDNRPQNGRIIREVTPCRINPEEAQKRAIEERPEAYSSRSFIARFERADRKPVCPDDYATMEEFTAARNKQVIRITRHLLPEATRYANDAQVLRLWSDYMKGRF